MRPVFKERLHYATYIQGATSSCDLSPRSDFICDLSPRSNFFYCDLSHRSDFIYCDLPPPPPPRSDSIYCDLSPRSDSIYCDLSHRSDSFYCDLSPRSDSIYCDLSPASKPNPTFQDLLPSPGWSFCMFYLVIILFVHVAKRCLFILAGTRGLRSRFSLPRVEIKKSLPVLNFFFQSSILLSVHALAFDPLIGLSET